MHLAGESSAIVCAKAERNSRSKIQWVRQYFIHSQVLAWRNLELPAYPYSGQTYEEMCSSF